MILLIDIMTVSILLISRFISNAMKEKTAYKVLMNDL